MMWTASAHGREPYLAAEVKKAGEIYTTAPCAAVSSDDCSHELLGCLSARTLLHSQLTHQRCHLFQADAAIAIQI